MDHTTYIQNLFYSFLQKTDNISGNMMFIKHYNTLNYSYDYISSIVGEVYRDGLMYHKFGNNSIKEPYEPFLSNIKRYYNKYFASTMSVSDFVDKCGVYSLHKEIFITYIEKGFARRSEPIVVSEGFYESGKFISSILGCYNFITKKVNVLLILDSFEYCSISTCSIMKLLVENSEICNIKLMVVYNEAHQSPTYVEKQFEEIVSYADEKGMILEWESEVKMNELSNRYFMPYARFFKEYLIKINNLVNTLALDDAECYITSIHNRIVEDKMTVDKRDRFTFYYYAAYCYVLKKDFNSALFMGQRLISLYDKETDLLEDYKFNYINCYTQMLVVQSELTVKYAEKCMKLARKMGDDELFFRAKVLIQCAQFEGWRDVFSIDFSLVQLEEGMIEELRSHHFLNTLAYYLIFGFDNDDMTIKKMADGVLSETYKEAIRLGKALGNNCFLLSAYTKYIIMFSERGYYKSVLGFYEEKYKIISKEKNERRKAHLLMGMGYSSMVGEEYAKANNSLIEAVDILYKLRNPEEIAEALYNMAQNCICAEDYVSAVEYLNVVFKILESLGIQTIQICNVAKLYELHALAYYKLGNEYKCYKLLENVKLNLSHLLDAEENATFELIQLDEEMFLYYLLKAVLEKNGGDYKNAGIHFEKAKGYFEKSQNTAFYAIITFVAEYYGYLMRVDKKTEAFELLDYGRKYCTQKGYLVKARRLLMFAENKNATINVLSADFGNITLDDVVELAHSIGKEAQLIESKKDIRFLSMWQEMLNKDDMDYNDIVDNSMKTLQKNFNLDEILLLNVEHEKIKVVYRDMNGDRPIDYDALLHAFELIRRKFVTNRNSKTFSQYENIASLFNKDQIVTMVGVPVFNDNNVTAIFIGLINRHKNFRHYRMLMDEERLMIMKTAIIQLYNGIERIMNKNNIVEMNRKLNELAVTDMLTGLYNRQGLAKQLEQYSNSHDMISILYADLDNFKYYNDTFGHDVGDVILKEFARVISEVSQNIGYAVRYGGDEFLVVLHNIGKDEARRVAEHIYEEISDGFVPVVRKYLNKEVEVPENRLVSCSIGIAFSEDGSLQHVNEAMKNADSALYYMKKCTKGNYVVWEDIHEEA